MRQYWASSYKHGTVGPYKTREEAVEAFFATFPNASDRCVSGYGTFGPHFDMHFDGRQPTTI